MKTKNKLFAFLLILTGLGLGTWLAVRRPASPGPAGLSLPVYDRYDYGRGDEARIVDIGVFSASLSATFFSECLFRDRVLRRQIAEEGWTLREHGYQNADNMIPYLDGRLDVLFLGDVAAMARHNIGIFALCRQGYNTIIASRTLTPEQLKGLRIGYPLKSIALGTLERALITANLSIKDIITVPMQPKDMAAALLDHSVDGIVSNEPTASWILANVPGSYPVFRSEALSYLAFDLEFAARHPDLQKALLAAMVRASRWAGESEKNILTGLLWVRQTHLSFMGRSVVEPKSQWLTLFRRETIDNPSFPMLPLDFDGDQGFLRRQFLFMQKIETLPADTDWKSVSDRVNTQLLPEIIRDGIAWKIEVFDYAPDKRMDAGRDSQ